MSSPLGTMLRPYLYGPASPLRRNVYLRFYSATITAKSSVSSKTSDNKPAETLWSTRSYEKRFIDLKSRRSVNEDELAFPGVLYPRAPANVPHGEFRAMNISEFKLRYHSLQPFENHKDQRTIRGKIKAIRTHGKKLVFVDVVQDDSQLQIMINLGFMEKKGYHSHPELERFAKEIRVGDFYQFSGMPARTGKGDQALTLSVTEHLPKLQAPSLHTIPASITDETTLSRFPQLDLLTQRKKRDLLRLRHHIEVILQGYLNGMNFTKVTTPILAADTGGAVARPFETTANFDGEKTGLKLRIAQELALKKLVAADLTNVYEIGPCFRNEGLDTTHNPEFTTCEFYMAYARLDTLMRMTEDLFCTIHSALEPHIQSSLTSLEEPHTKLAASLRPGTTFQKLPFLPTLLDQLNRVASSFRLPKVLDEEAVPEILALFEELKLAIPAHPTVARLLDALSSEFVEPLCIEPTFITFYPSIMSPLSKSFPDPETGHTVSARAELFINGIEYCNMYEEENDPFSQAEKFFLQQSPSHSKVLEDLRRDEPNFLERARFVKERLTPGQRYFVRVLECGLPPTGGWGMGLDRLVMLFGGAGRIADVLPFGNLRGVIAIGTEVGGVGGGLRKKMEEDGENEKDRVPPPRPANS
ncbi:class II aaRS and biotin synthetase [Tothia fuscella]|uniref:Class II aaRS and biotin synthetase n=1 Tax=Tothia fuscella TaxID=1048955 RepID=A0A9P4NQA0_9PEZI|nr:class II aaRS and biotin synthetase [Tothia fuscella]